MEDALNWLEKADFQVMPRFTAFLTILFFLWSVLLLAIKDSENFISYVLILIPSGFLSYGVGLPPVLLVILFTGLGFLLGLVLPQMWKSNLGRWVILVLFLLNSCGFLCVLMLAL